MDWKVLWNPGSTEKLLLSPPQRDRMVKDLVYFLILYSIKCKLS